MRDMAPATSGQFALLLRYPRETFAALTIVKNGIGAAVLFQPKGHVLTIAIR
jgi:hypothetical protein